MGMEGTPITLGTQHSSKGCAAGPLLVAAPPAAGGWAAARPC